jgi:plastocyanin
VTISLAVRSRLGRVSCALVLAALLTSAGQAAAGGVPAKPRTHTVIIEGTRFLPETLTVKAGDTIVWVNKDLFPHSATASNATFNSQVIAAGESWRYAAKTKGEFAYTCIFHPTMKASLLVK